MCSDAKKASKSNNKLIILVSVFHGFHTNRNKSGCKIEYLSCQKHHTKYASSLESLEDPEAFPCGKV